MGWGREEKESLTPVETALDRSLHRPAFETEGSLISRVPFTGLKIMAASFVASDAATRIHCLPKSKSIQFLLSITVTSTASLKLFL